MDCNATAINPFNRALVHPNIAISIQMHKFKWEWEFDVENRSKNQHRYTFYFQIFCCCCCSTFSLDTLRMHVCMYVCCVYGANRWNTQFSMQYAPKPIAMFPIGITFIFCFKWHLNLSYSQL